MSLLFSLVERNHLSKQCFLSQNFEWIDIHGKCLDVLCNIYNDPCIAQHFLRDGVLQLFNYIEFINDAQLRKKAVEAIAKIAETPLGRKVKFTRSF